MVNYSRHSKTSNIFQRLTVLRIINQFGRKRCQRKRKGVSYHLLECFFQKYFVVHERSAVKNLFSTYVWSKVYSCFCESVYIKRYYVKYLVSFFFLQKGKNLSLFHQTYFPHNKPLSSETRDMWRGLLTTLSVTWQQRTYNMDYMSSEQKKILGPKLKAIKTVKTNPITFAPRLLLAVKNSLNKANSFREIVSTNQLKQ